MLSTADSDNEIRCYSPSFDVVAIAASTGGSAVYRRLLSVLPPDFPAAILVVQHRDPRFAELLPNLLRVHLALPVEEAGAGTRLDPGTVYVAPASGQLVIGADRRLAVRSGSGIGRVRCTADPLLRSVAAQYGPRAIGVILTGNLEDGAAGIRSIKAMGGRVIVQDPATAQAPGMPSAAIATGCIDFILPPESIAHALVSLVMAPGADALFRVPLPSWARPDAPFAIPA